MPQQHLDKADVGTPFQHVSGTGVPKYVARAVDCQPASVEVTTDEVAEAILRERFAIVRQEEATDVLPLRREQWANRANVRSGPSDRAGSEWHDPVAPALARPHEYDAAFQIDVVQPEARELGPSHAGGVEHLEDGSITYSGWGVKCRKGKHALDLANAGNTLRQSSLHPRKNELTRGIFERYCIPCEPTAERPQRVKARRQRSHCKGLAVALPIARKEALIGLEEVARDGVCVLHPLPIAPEDEMIQGRAPDIRRLVSEANRNCPIDEARLQLVKAIIAGRLSRGRTSRDGALGSEHASLTQLRCQTDSRSIEIGPNRLGWDAELYNYFRDYDPGIGRYVQSDPIGLTAGVTPTPMSSRIRWALKIRMA